MAKTQDKIQITKDKMQKYENVRVSGVTNMFDVPRVMELTRLTREEILDIMKHYDVYMTKLGVKRG